MMAAPLMIRVEAPHFVAGITLQHGRMSRPCAPILKWAVGKTAEAFWLACQDRGWRTEPIA